MVSYSQSVISSITGLMEEAFGVGSLRMILPKEVVIVSTYVTPVMLSFMTQLELTLDIPGASPMDMAPTDTSSVFKQAITHSKLHGRVEGFTGATAFVDGEGLDGEGTLGRQMGDFTGFTWNMGRIFLSVSKSRLAEGSPQQQLLAKMDVIPYPIQQTSWFIPWVVVPVQGVSLGCWGEGVVKPFSSYASGMDTPQKTSSSVKFRYHFTSSLSSNMPFTNKQGSPPVGGSFCSTQY